MREGGGARPQAVEDAAYSAAPVAASHVFHCRFAAACLVFRYARAAAEDHLVALSGFFPPDSPGPVIVGVLMFAERDDGLAFDLFDPVGFEHAHQPVFPVVGIGIQPIAPLTAGPVAVQIMGVNGRHAVDAAARGLVERVVNGGSHCAIDRFGDPIMTGVVAIVRRRAAAGLQLDFLHEPVGGVVI